MCQLDRLHSLKSEIYQIAHKYNADKVYVFGSCARKEETPNSDIDFIADFSKKASLFDHVSLELALSDLLGCAVDVVSIGALRQDTFGRQVRQEMVLL